MFLLAGVQGWSSASPREQWRTGKNGENLLQNHLWCPINPCGYGTDDDVHGTDLLCTDAFPDRFKLLVDQSFIVRLVAVE